MFPSKLLFIIFLRYCVILDSKDVENYMNLNRERKGSAIEFRTVLINCESDWHIPSLEVDSEKTRFQREELFKHNALRDCSKKLALTLKVTSDPEGSTSDDYIPIEHVYEGPNNKRYRLLNPYVLCLRREQPREAYKLFKIKTVPAIFTHLDVNKKESISNGMVRKQKRPRRVIKENKGNTNLSTFTNMHFGGTLKTKRHLSKNHNVVVEEYHNDLGNLDTFGHGDYVVRSKNTYNDPQDSSKPSLLRQPYKKYKLNDTPHPSKSEKANMNSSTEPKTDNLFHYDVIEKNSQKDDSKAIDEDSGDLKPKDYIEKLIQVYRIDDPNILYSVNIKFYGKSSTPDGKTYWNDLTKGETACLNSNSPEWTSSDINVRYKPAEWLNRYEFGFTSKEYSLLMPQRIDNSDGFMNGLENVKDFIIVPTKDIKGLTEDENKKRDIHNITEKNYDQVLYFSIPITSYSI